MDDNIVDIGTRRARGRKSQKAGNDFEARMANRMGARIVSGSGNTPYALLDLEGRKFLWSLKHTDADSFRLTQQMVDEAVSAARAKGADPGIAIELGEGGEIMVWTRFNDFKALVTEGITIMRESKAEARIRTARTPALGRD